MSVTRLGSFSDPLEGHGVSLVNAMVARLRSSDLSLPPLLPAPEGPHFVFETSPTLFSNRTGRGPLRVAWDTNLLIDYFEQGRRLWAGEDLPGEVPTGDSEELEGLQLLIAMWVVRDIRFQIPDFFLRDSKSKPLSAERRSQRRHAMRHFLAALAFTDEGVEHGRQRTTHATDDYFLQRLPRGNDRLMVGDALRSGADVFLTRDAGVLKARAALRMLGLLVASPLDVVEELSAAGAMHCLFSPEYLYWPMPDQARVAHLVSALH